MSSVIEDRVFDLTLQVQELTMIIKDLKNQFSNQPDSYPISALVAETNRRRQTIRRHIIKNYESDKDFYFKNGKIFVDGKTFVSIKEYYANKSK